MKTERELITQMLEALEEAQKYAHNIGKYLHGVPQAITAAREYLSKDSQESEALAAPEQSEPVAILEITVRGDTTTIDNHFSAAIMGWPAGEYQLYTQPAPKAEPPLTFGWLTACDEEMVGAHLGVANLSDSYESAKAKLRTLIDWHVAVAADPAVNGKPSSQPKAEPVLQDIEQYRMQMAGICTAALGYWKEGDSIHPDYDTPALRDVAKLYSKYNEHYKAKQEPVNQRLLEALKYALDWVDAVANGTPLPPMPGFDRDWVDGVIAAAEQAQ